MSARILIVEDDPVSRDLLGCLLAARGYTVDTADDSFGALRLIQDRSYDLVFIDYHLPEMDGYALARMMRTLGEKTSLNLNMVAITADKFGLAARRGADVVFDRILTKPIDPDALYAFVDDYIATGRGEFRDISGALAADAGAAPIPLHAQLSPALLLWQGRGLDALPAAAAFPEPSLRERASLESCFRLVEPADADCLVLLGSNGIPAVEAFREKADAFLKPVICLDDAGLASADMLFDVEDAASWTRLAALIASFRARAAQLSADVRAATDVDTRFAAYLFASDRKLTLTRDATGRAELNGAGGFRPAAAVNALKRLGLLGHVAARPIDGRAGELSVALTVDGEAHATGARRSAAAL